VFKSQTFVLVNTNEDILKKVCNQAIQNCSVSHVPQNTICVQQLKEMFTGLEQPEGEYMMTEFSLRGF